MNRTQLINYLVEKRSARKYLEISSPEERGNFARVRCVAKVQCAGPNSDQFFTRNDDLFDIIFIDGLHTEAQVSKDISQALQCLESGGMLLVHDCMPPDAWHQREHQDFSPGENWNGTVWKAVLRYFNGSPFKCSLLNTDWGIGIIDTSQSQKPKNISLPEQLEYGDDYQMLLEYRMSVAEYLRSDVKTFYHLACMGNWQQVFTEQMQQLGENGFNSINLTVLGTGKNLAMANSICADLHIRTCLVFTSPEFNFFETPSLLAIEEYARRNEGYVLYLHSKGVSNPADASKEKWRRLMMKELVQNWENCVLQLAKYDLVGVNWRDMPPNSHFCGNFWYASTRHLRKLTDFNYYYGHPTYKIGDSINEKRLGCEFWISSSRKPPALLSLVHRNVDFCNPEFWRNR